MNDKSVLVIGEHNVGKTNYGVQLLGRLRANACEDLSLDGTPDTIAAFEAGLKALHQGLAPAHTPTLSSLKLVLPLKFNNQSVALDWPDYGGEQIREMLKSRSLSTTWQDRIAKADAWILFLRLSAIDDPLDAIELPTPKTNGKASRKPANINVTEGEKPWNSNARTIELMQMLLYEKGVGICDRVKSPALVVALSCWDELKRREEDTPAMLLQQHLPLLYEFLKTVWDADRLSVFGVSSLGMAIESSKVNEVFRDEGPDRQGFAIDAKGLKTADLSIPIKWLMERV